MSVSHRNLIRGWFLTYSQVGELKCSTVLEHLQSLVHGARADSGDLGDYIVAAEDHKDGGRHIHVYAQFTKGVRRSEIAVFDMLVFRTTQRHTWMGTRVEEEEPTAYHGNYQAARSPLAVCKYITKDGDFITNIVNVENYGQCKKRKIREEILELGAEHAMANYLIAAKDYLPVKRSLDAYMLHTKERRTFEDTRGMWITGVTGAGKTHFALEYAKERNLTVFSKDANKWWDGYAGQGFVLIDDVSPSDMKYMARKVKLWMDKWNLAMCEVKNGSIPTDYDVFCVTSQYTIEECFADLDPRDGDAIRRRCVGRIYRIDADRNVVLETEEEPVLGLGEDGQLSGGLLKRNGIWPHAPRYDSVD